LNPRGACTLRRFSELTTAYSCSAGEPGGESGRGDNGHPNDPFRGDAVPGGNSTSHGTQSNGPINSDGFLPRLWSLLQRRRLSSLDRLFVWPDNTTIKYARFVRLAGSRDKAGDAFSRSRTHAPIVVGLSRRGTRSTSRSLSAAPRPAGPGTCSGRAALRDDADCCSPARRTSGTDPGAAVPCGRSSATSL
jgi:hypothetical protein